jgi:hypothetical protein
MTFKEINDWCRIDEQKVVIQKAFQAYLFQSTRSLQSVRTLSFPQSFLPDPLRGNNDRWRDPESYSSIGTSAATGRPYLLIIVGLPFSAASRRSGN